MSDNPKPIDDLPQFFQALMEAFEDVQEDAAIVTIEMPGGQLYDFEISFIGEHDPEAEDSFGGGDPIWKDDTQG